jgi:hypothetical protein
VNQQAPHRERYKNQTKKHVLRVRAVVDNIYAFHHGQSRHQKHQDQIESLVQGLTSISCQLIPP